MIVAATSVQRALRPSNSKIFNGRCKILRIIFLLVGCSIAWLLKWTPYAMQTTVCQNECFFGMPSVKITSVLTCLSLPHYHHFLISPFVYLCLYLCYSIIITVKVSVGALFD